MNGKILIMYCAFFQKRKFQARRQYRSFVKNGVADGRRPDLIGGGLLRSSGGWSAIKACRKAGIRLKGDERILGDSEFVGRVLDSENERLELLYILEAKGYDFGMVVKRVAAILGMKAEDVLRSGKQAISVKARSLVSYWANRELGMTTVQIAERLNIYQSAASRSSLRGEKIAKNNQLQFF